MIHCSGTTVANLEQEAPDEQQVDCIMVNAASFKLASKQKNVQVFAASLRDIEKALKAKTYSDPKEKLPKEYHPWLDVFDQTAAERLPPHRKGQDHAIQLEPKADGSVPEVP